MVIPDWNFQAVMPTVRDVPSDEQALPENRSPFQAATFHLVERFATTPERVQLLHDLLDYRSALYAVGITEGYQWIDGSFVENVEARPRPGKEPRPYDIDVVTFFTPLDDEPPELVELFQPRVTRERYNIDAYPMTLGVPLDDDLVESITYWYGMWSTRREDHTPKGFVRVDLNPEHDREAREALNAIQL